MSPGRRESLIVGGVAAAAALIGGLFGVRMLNSRSDVASLLAASFTDLAGKPRQLREWHGRPLVCNFWATWCAPCREEIPLLGAAQQQFSPDSLQVVGIAIDNAANVRQFVALFKIPYPVLLAGAEAIALMEELGNPSGALPFTVLVDRQGRLVDRRLGAYSEAELRSALVTLVQ
jgi:thiol-disulfide isomerase/thioredoxin